jgi:integrase
VTNARVQRLKAGLSDKSPKTVNNVLSVLSVMLKKANEWGVIDDVPCRIRLLKVMQGEPTWYEPHEYERLARAAAKCDQRLEVMIRLGGEAGLRRGEFIALRWTDIDFERGHIKVKRSIWDGHETSPKGNRARVIPMTRTLAACLKTHRHLRSARVLCQDDGTELTNKLVRTFMERAQRQANLDVTGAVHRLRHTFCSMLAMKGAPAKAIQELAGHADLSTTMRYMHLSPATRDRAIDLLDEALGSAQTEPTRGEMLEKASG